MTLLVLAMCALGGAEPSATKPNVLFVVFDDLNCKLGCYGAKVHSPRLDKFAEHGVRFDRAYCQYPLCCPSRASFMTGLRPETTRVWGNGKHFRDNIPDAITLAELFRKQGYRTGRVGKIYHMGIPGGIGEPGVDDPASWDFADNPAGIGPDPKFLRIREEHKDQPEDEHPDGQVAVVSMRRLEELRDRGQPFFLAIGFYRPHGPFIATRADHDLYRPEDMEVPLVTQEELARIPPIAFREGQPGRIIRNPANRQRGIANYQAAITFVDRQFGRVIDHLERLGLVDNTIVIAFSDHGHLEGEHGTGGKSVLFEPALRVPLIVAGPGVTTRSKVSPALVELVDLYPTLAEWCGLPAPANLEGTSFLPLLTDPDRPWKKAAYSSMARKWNRKDSLGQSMRTERYQFIRWPDGSEELYDMQVDPHQHLNLAVDSAHDDLRSRLRAQLEAGWRAAVPQ